MIQVGDTLPDVTFMSATPDGPKPTSVDEVFGGRTVALFAVPGAFTPTCSARHLPSFKDKAEELKAKGVDLIACTSVNDAFVMGAWAKDQGVMGEMAMLADGNADFARALGLVLDGRGFGMGERSKRYAMLVKNKVVEQLHVEEPGEYRVSSAEYLLSQMP